MQNESLALENNYCKGLEPHIKKNLRFANDQKRFIYPIKTNMFIGDHILEILTVVSYIKKHYKQRIPLTIDVSECGFYDKLVYVILESLFFYFYNDLSYDIKIILRSKPSIYTEGMAESPLIRNMINKNQFISAFKWNIGRMHYRKLVPGRSQQKPDLLSNRSIVKVNSTL